MPLFRKINLVEGHRWFKNGDHPNDNPVLMHDKEAREHFANGQPEGEVVRRFRHPNISGDMLCSLCGKPMQDHGWIDASHVGYVVCPGDWVMSSRDGTYWSLAPQLLAATYKEVVRVEGAMEGQILKSHDESRVTVVDEFQLDSVSMTKNPVNPRCRLKGREQ